MRSGERSSARHREVFAVATRAMRSAMISLPYVRRYWLVHASPRKQAKVDDKVVALFLKDRSDKAEIAKVFVERRRLFPYSASCGLRRLSGLSCSSRTRSLSINSWCCPRAVEQRETCVRFSGWIRTRTSSRRSTFWEERRTNWRSGWRFSSLWCATAWATSAASVLGHALPRHSTGALCCPSLCNFRKIPAERAWLEACQEV